MIRHYYYAISHYYAAATSRFAAISAELRYITPFTPMLLLTRAAVRFTLLIMLPLRHLYCRDIRLLHCRQFTPLR